MITLADKMKVIQMHLTGYSNRKIARELGVNRKTVGKYVAEYEAAQAVITGPGAPPDAVREAAESISAAPAYKERKSPPRKWNAEMDDFLDEILASEEEKRKLLRTGKQQLTKTQIHALMREAGFDIGLTTVCRRVNAKRQAPAEAFVAQTCRYGQRFEYDFGEARLYIGGRYAKVFMAVMTAPASGYRFALLYPNQRFEAFADSQVRFFEHMGGCFEEGVYDNMRNVVASFTGRGGKLLNERLMSLAAYYGFRVVTTNVRAGNEKGSVENAVKVVRSAAFAARWEFDSLEDAQARLDAALAGLNAGRPVDEERAALTPRRPPYEVADIRPGAAVDKYSCVTVGGSQYSVPDCFVGKKVLVKAYPNEVVCMSGGEVVARHARSLSEGAMVLDVRHYLRTFLRKPGALANSTALAAEAELKAVFDEMYRDRPREFASIMLACGDATVGECAAALRDRRAPSPGAAGRRGGDAIAEQALAQIKLIGAMGRSVA